MKFTENISCLSLLLIGVKEVLSKDSSIKAEVLVYGTPAEEGGGGKVKMIEHNVFDEVDICMMSHPAPLEYPSQYGCQESKCHLFFMVGIFVLSVYFKTAILRVTTIYWQALSNHFFRQIRPLLQ